MTTEFACQRFAGLLEFFQRAECECRFDPDDDEELLTEALDNASDILYLATDGMVHGRCEVTVRPIGEGWCGPPGHFGMMSSEYGWDRGIYTGTIPLRGPDTEVVRVIVDSVILGGSEYELLNGTYLNRVGASWPSGSLTADDFEITYRFGRPADLLTRNATIELACELASYGKTNRTRLPAGVTSANIQGASVQLRQEFEEGSPRGYLPRVGAFLAAYAPRSSAAANSGGVYSPELSLGWQLVVVTGPSGS